MNKKRIAIAVQSALWGATALFATQAVAFDDAESQVSKPAVASETNEKIAKEAVEKITVTGSRLRRDSFSVATPLATMDREAIEDTGIGSLSDILIDELPQISEGSSNSNSQSSVQNTGLSTIDLRELGTNRTLTLVDGRRVVSNSYSGNYVSLSTIPSGMVDRVEVITGGASAAYGSDAIAGVVNIITQQDKEGFSAKVRGGESVEGGAKEFGLDFDYGSEISGGDGYVFVAASYDKEYGLSYWDRDRAQIHDSWSYDSALMCNQMLTADGRQCMRDITQADWQNLSDDTPGGVFLETSRNDTQFWYDGQTLRNDWRDNEERYGHNYQQYTMLRVPDEKASVALKLDYDLTDDVSFYGQVQFSLTRSENDKTPEGIYDGENAITRDLETGEFGEIRVGYIPFDNPFIPQEIIDSDPYRDRIYFDRRLNEVGNIINKNDRTTIRSWFGLQGTAFDGDWDWDLSVGYGTFKQEQRRTNEINLYNLKNALDAEMVDGEIVCRNSVAEADPGCVPINLFGEGSITPEMADYIRYGDSVNIDSKIDQLTITGYMAGDLFEMPAGPVSSAFGFEYRKDTQDVSTNVPQGGVSFNYVPDFKESTSVSEIFGEVAIPLLKDVKGAKSLSAELSVRLGYYDLDQVDLVQSYRTGLIWEPIEGYGIRANWARAQRAPTITEAFSPPRGDFDSFDDICDGTTLTSTDPGHDNCRLVPAIADAIADGSEFEDDNSGYSPNAGNTDLIEETADTITLGITLAPSFLENFRMAVDYYDISIEDAMTSYGNEDIIGYCYNSDFLDFGPENSFCQDVKRDGDGQISEVTQRLYNQDEIRTSGYDIAAEYKLDLADGFGRLKFKVDWTHVTRYEEKTITPEGAVSTEDFVGSLASDVFEDKASASVTWYKEAWRVRWSMKYRGEMLSSKSRYEDFYAPLDEDGNGGIFAEYEAACAADATACVDNPETPYQLFLPSYVRNDVSVSYSTELENDTQLRLFGGINNVFDNNGPFILGGTGNYDSNYGGGKGRFYYLGAEVSF